MTGHVAAVLSAGSEQFGGVLTVRNNYPGV